MKEIVVYSTATCSKCQVLKSILDNKKIDYKVESNMEKIMEIAKEIGTSELPILEITLSGDEEFLTRYYSGSEAVMKGKGM